MGEFGYIVCFLAGILFVVAAAHQEVPRGSEANRPLVGAALILCAVCWQAASLTMFAAQESFFGMAELLYPIFFWLGLALFLPKPHPHAEIKEHGVPGHILCGIGIALGVANLLASLATPWPHIKLDLVRTYIANI